MDALSFRPIVTVVDVLDTGACITGVFAFVMKNGRIIETIASAFPDNNYIQAAARADGYGDGSGYGYGDGYGSGDGYGYG